jgi:hypothetical protein
VNTIHEVLDWFRPSRGLIFLRPVLMYYTIEIDFSFFLLGSFGGLSGIFQGFSEMSRGSFWIVHDVDLSSLFIVRELSHRV